MCRSIKTEANKQATKTRRGLCVTEATTNHPIWWHYLSIIVPDVIKYKQAVVFIDGGSNNNGWEEWRR